MISPNSWFKLVWNMLILVLAIYTAVLLPIRLAFMDENNISKPMYVFDLFTDIVFILDIIINFFFVDEDVNGEMITD